MAGPDRSPEYEFYVDALVNVVIIFISRFQDVHAAATHHSQVQTSLQDDHDAEEEEKNIHLISRALDQSLFLIDNIVRVDEENKGHVDSESREMSPLPTFTSTNLESDSETEVKPDRGEAPGDSRKRNQCGRLLLCSFMQKGKRKNHAGHPQGRVNDYQCSSSS